MNDFFELPGKCRRVWPGWISVLAFQRWCGVPRAPKDATRQPEKTPSLSPRLFGWAALGPLALSPSASSCGGLRSLAPRMPGEPGPALSFADFRLTPHYPGKSPLDEVLRYVEPGS